MYYLLMNFPLIKVIMISDSLCSLNIEI